MYLSSPWTRLPTLLWVEVGIRIRFTNILRLYRLLVLCMVNIANSARAKPCQTPLSTVSCSSYRRTQYRLAQVPTNPADAQYNGSGHGLATKSSPGSRLRRPRIIKATLPMILLALPSGARRTAQAAPSPTATPFPSPTCHIPANQPHPIPTSLPPPGSRLVLRDVDRAPKVSVQLLHHAVADPPL